MFENLKKRISEELCTKDINNLDEYVYELHELLPNYLANVPEQDSDDYHEFAGKFMQYLWDNQDELDEDIIANIGYTAKIFMLHYDEYFNVTSCLASQCDEDITDDIIILIKSYCDDTSGIIGDSDEAEQILNDIFTYINHDWTNMIGVTLDWDKVLESITFNDYTPLPDEDSQDETEFEISGLFSFMCVTGTRSAKKALEVIYKDCGWVGHPEDEIEAGTDFPNYGVIDQEEADWFNANMSAIFDYYDGDPNEYALRQIDPEQFDDEDDDDIENIMVYNISSKEANIKITEALKNNELQVIGNSNGKAIVSFDDACDALGIDIASDYYTDSTADAILSAGTDKFVVYDSDVLYQIVNHHDGFTEKDSEGIEQFDEPMSYDEFLTHIVNKSSEDDDSELSEDWLNEVEQELLEEYDYEINESEIQEWLEDNRFDYTSEEFDTLKEYLEAEGWTITDGDDDNPEPWRDAGYDDSVTDDVVNDFISDLENEYSNSEITYDELLDAYNDSDITHLISMFNIAEMLDGQGWTITEIPDYAESFKERFGN